MFYVLMFLLATLDKTSANEIDYSECLKNFGKLSEVERGLAKFKCYESELLIAEKRVKTIKCIDRKNSNYTSPRKRQSIISSEIDQYYSTSVESSKVVADKIEVIYDKNGRPLKLTIGSNNRAFNDSFFTETLSFQYVDNKCIADSFYKGHKDKNYKKYDVMACVEWQEYLESIPIEKLSQCANDLAKIQLLYDKYFERVNYSSYESIFLTKQSYFSDKLNTNCFHLESKYGIHTSVKILKEARKTKQTSLTQEEAPSHENVTLPNQNRTTISH